MKFVISLLLSLFTVTSSVFSYNQENLQQLEQASAVTAMTAAIMQSLMPNGTQTKISILGDTSQNINKILAYALHDQTFIANVAKVLDHVTTHAPWQDAKHYDKEFLKKFFAELAHGVGSETAEYGKDLLLNKIFTYLPKNIILRRSIDTVTTALILSLTDTAADSIKNALLPTPQEPLYECFNSFVETFVTNLLTEAAFHTMAEVVLRESRIDSIDTGILKT